MRINVLTTSGKFVCDSVKVVLDEFNKSTGMVLIHVHPEFSCPRSIGVRYYDILKIEYIVSERELATSEFSRFTWTNALVTTIWNKKQLKAKISPNIHDHNRIFILYKDNFNYKILSTYKVLTEIYTEYKSS